MLTPEEYQRRYAEIERRFYDDSRAAVAKYRNCFDGCRRSTRYVAGDVSGWLTAHVLEGIQKEFEDAANALELEWINQVYDDFGKTLASTSGGNNSSS